MWFKVSHASKSGPWGQYIIMEAGFSAVSGMQSFFIIPKLIDTCGPFTNTGWLKSQQRSRAGSGNLTHR